MECRAAEVRASDIGYAVAERREVSVEEIGLGVEALASGDEDADIESIGRFFLEIEEAQERVGVPPSPRLRRGKPVMLR